jgi:hypothetical protein
MLVMLMLAIVAEGFSLTEHLVLLIIAVVSAGALLLIILLAVISLGSARKDRAIPSREPGRTKATEPARDPFVPGENPFGDPD